MKITKEKLISLIEEEIMNELSPARESDIEADKSLITELYKMALARAGEKGLEGEEARNEAARFLSMAQNLTWKGPAAPEVDVEDVMFKEES